MRSLREPTSLRAHYHRRRRKVGFAALRLLGACGTLTNSALSAHNPLSCFIMSARSPRLSDSIDPEFEHASQHAALMDLLLRKVEAETGDSPHLSPQTSLFSDTPHYDLASFSSTAYIALPPLQNMPDEISAAPKGKLASFFQRNFGLFLLATAQMFFSIMNLCAKLLTLGDPPIHPFEIIFLRMLVTWTGGVIYLNYNKIPNWFFGPKEVRLLLVFRSFTGFFGLFGIYYSLQYLDLSDATVLTFLSPILTGYFGRIFLKEPFLRTELYAGILSFIGVFLIARPQALFGNAPENSGEASGLQRLAAVGVALLGVMGAAGAFVSIRAIGRRAHPLISVSMFALYSTIVSSIAMIVLKIPLVFPRSIAGWLEWIVIGLSGFVAQYLMTSGLQRERAGRGASMVYLQMACALGFERYLALHTCRA
jgi:drug/metabolite transporter (DMT)-like permease